MNTDDKKGGSMNIQEEEIRILENLAVVGDFSAGVDMLDNLIAIKELKARKDEMNDWYNNLNVSELESMGYLIKERIKVLEKEIK